MFVTKINNTNKKWRSLGALFLFGEFYIVFFENGDIRYAILNYCLYYSHKKYIIMQEMNVQKILEELKQVYPKYEVSALPTQQRGGRYLFVVSGFGTLGDIDDWFLQEVSPFYREMLKFLEQRVDVWKYIRLLFVRGNQFVLYSPDMGLGNVFYKMEKAHQEDCFGYYENQYYIGECLNINDVLEYLTTTKVWF